LCWLWRKRRAYTQAGRLRQPLVFLRRGLAFPEDTIFAGGHSAGGGKNSPEKFCAVRRFSYLCCPFFIGKAFFIFTYISI